jgi:site-specific DNA-methyltransferase (adenine-specific)
MWKDVLDGSARWAVECGDCRDVLPLLPDGCIDALITDPPYCIHNRFGVQTVAKKGRRVLQFEWDNEVTADDVAHGIALGAGLCKPSAALWVFTSIDIISTLLAVCREEQFVCKPAAWVKKHPPPALNGNWWPSAFELAFYGYRGRAWFGDVRTTRSNVFVFDSLRNGQPGKVGHPTQKPLDLMAYIVESICPPNGVVLDPFGGSGSTLAACVHTGRKCVLIEKDRRWCDVAERRAATTVTSMFTE